MIRTLLAHEGTLIRGALAFVLGSEPDIEVVAEIGHFDQLVDAVIAYRPDVAVLDLGLLPGSPGRSSDDLPGLWALHHTLPVCRMLVLTELRRSGLIGAMIAHPTVGLGFLATEGPPERLVTAVRKLASGEPMIDPELVVRALRLQSPLTPRETQVLSVAAEGVPVAEIADRLRLSAGTVRNHLSRVIVKTGARTRIEAVKIAQEAGWI